MTKIISVHSFRGGTGKSNLTANLAVAVCKGGRRVALVDTDIQSPGVHVLFGLQKTVLKHSLNDFLWGDCKIEQAAYEVKPFVDSASDMPAGLYVVPSSLNAGNIARILNEGYDVALLNDGFRSLGRVLNLDYLFIDTHPGVNEETLLSIAISNGLVMILRPDNQDFLGSAVTVDLARRLDVPEMLAVLNKVPPGLDHASLAKRTESLLHVPVAGVFPLSNEMAHLGSSGIFLLKYPDHPFTKEIQRVADALVTLTSKQQP